MPSSTSSSSAGLASSEAYTKQQQNYMFFNFLKTFWPQGPISILSQHFSIFIFYFYWLLCENMFDCSAMCLLFIYQICYFQEQTVFVFVLKIKHVSQQKWCFSVWHFWPFVDGSVYQPLLSFFLSLKFWTCKPMLQ